MMMTTNERIGTLALEAMLFEVSATPKPGLVDRNNAGAHSDMGFFSFLRSAASLHSFFGRFAESGQRGGRDGVAPVDVFPELRRIGIEAERAMFEATGGVNTHKGEVFSLGVLSGAAGYLVGRGDNMVAEEVMRVAGAMCSGLCERDFKDARTKSPELLTKGERIYLELGVAGVRGEAEAGYPVVRDYGLPALKRYVRDGLSMNDSLVMTLIHLMAANNDTNIIARHGLSVCEEVKARSRELIESGAGISEIRGLDDEFISRNISPSGSADLLAVAYFLFGLEAGT